MRLRVKKMFKDLGVIVLKSWNLKFTLEKKNRSESGNEWYDIDNTTRG